MAKTKTTVYLDEDILRSARVLAARKDLKDSEVMERALRQYLGLDLLGTIWAQGAGVDDDQALAMETDEVRAHRRGE